MKRIFTLLTLGLVLAVGAGSAKAAKPDKGTRKADRAAKRDRQAGVGGVVLKVEGAMITLQGRGKNATEVTVATDANTKFEDVASAADIKPGMRLMVTPSTGTAQKIVVHEGKGKGAKKLKNK